ncbi:MAG: CheY-specific phosphatase CheX [Bradymonadia bacterium]|jgi:CheY-specific phosphatase CheX
MASTACDADRLNPALRWVDGLGEALLRLSTAAATMTHDDHQILEKLLETCLLGLFKVYGIEMERVISSDDVPCPSLAGIVGFSGERMRGTMLLAAPTQTLQACSCHGGRLIDPDDWVGELTNQLMGRVKNAGYELGLEFAMSTPVAVRGVALQFRSPDVGDVWQLFFACEHGLTRLRLSAEMLQGFSLGRSDGAARQSAAEGEVLLF